MILDRDKGLFENVKNIISSYPGVIKDSWKERRYHELLFSHHEVDSLVTRITRTLFTMVFYFPVVALLIIVELATGVPVYETQMQRLERLEREGKLDASGKAELEDRRRFWKIQHDRIQMMKKLDTKRALQNEGGR